LRQPDAGLLEKINTLDSKSILDAACVKTAQVTENAHIYRRCTPIAQIFYDKFGKKCAGSTLKPSQVLGRNDL
jgi:hypothetical protein